MWQKNNYITKGEFKMQHLMIDLETMGKKSNAAIISIGAIFFGKEGVSYDKSFYRKVNLQSCINLGLEIDASTVMWWMQQSNESRNEFVDNYKSRNIKYVLSEFSGFFEANNESVRKMLPRDTKNDICVWGNGANFDISILENAYNKSHKKVPWFYNLVRCFRTYKAMNPVINNLPNDRPAHNALEDAIWQAEYAVEIMNGRFI
jgi:hypothetical protein